MTHIILYAIVPIIVVMLAGYISGKKGIFSGDDAKKFNKVVLDYALPAALFVSIAQASREMLAKDIKLSLISLVGIMLCFMIVYYVFLMFKKNTGADAAVSALISGSPTIGFLGFAVLEPIFGTTPSVALVVAIVGIVVNAVGIPVGLSLMNASLEKQNPGSSKGKSAWTPVIHALEQPVAWAPILAVVWVLVGIPWPDWASPSFDLIKGANASMAVFSAGITLSAIKIQLNWQAVLGSILKPQDACCSSRTSTGILRYNYCRRIRHLCSDRYFIINPFSNLIHRLLPVMDMDHRYVFKSILTVI